MLRNENYITQTTAQGRLKRQNCFCTCSYTTEWDLALNIMTHFVTTVWWGKHEKKKKTQIAEFQSKIQLYIFIKSSKCRPVFQQNAFYRETSSVLPAGSRGIE